MADAAAAPDKTKEKSKKKKTTSSKDKDKESRRKSSAGGDPAEQPKPEPAAAPAPAPAPAEAEQPKPEAAKPKEKKQSKKEKAKPEGGPEEKTDASRKASVADTTGAAAEGAPEAAEEAVGGAEPNEGDEIPQPPEDHEIQASYVVPPAATKKDIDLLMDMDESKLLELKEAFELFDLNQDGVIDASDLKHTFLSLGQTDMPEEEIVDMLSEAINPMDFDAFVILLGYKTIEMDPEAILVEALSQWDYSNSGLISEDRIKHDLMTWGDKFTREEAEMALEDAPVYVNKKTGSAMIDYLKFCNTLSGLRKKTKMPGPEDFITQ